MNKDFTKEEIERQDFVDNEIHNLMLSLSPVWNEIDGSEIDWDIDIIGEIRDTIEYYLVEKLKLMTKQEFYPSIELLPQPKQDAFIVSDKNGDLSRCARNFVDDMGVEDFSKYLSALFGGKCFFVGDYKYRFIPTDAYGGQLDDIKREEEK